jgi:hypothetical protein
MIQYFCGSCGKVCGVWNAMMFVEYITFIEGVVFNFELKKAYYHVMIFHGDDEFNLQMTQLRMPPQKKI